MRRCLILLVLLSLAACTNGQNTPPPSTPTSDTVPPASISPTTVPDTSEPTDASITDTPPNAAAFPNPDSYEWQTFLTDLQRPVDLQPDGSGRLFIIEKVGRIRIFQDGQLLAQPFLDISDRVGSNGNEQGLLGLAFHPQSTENGRFFVNYTNNNGNTVIAEFRVSSDQNRVDPGGEVKLLEVDQPFPNHNGGVLAFGRDGYLYAGLGDGGAAGDPRGNGQSLDTLLGKILRLDVNSAQPYGIPADNPFGNEIWAYGLRNPWRMSFDKLTGDLYIGDVGQGEWEEIDFLAAGSAGGANFGWDFREGAHEYEGGGPDGMIDPIAEYSHSEGSCSITGGYVYRGSMAEWNGIYLYGDYCTGLIWGLIRSNDGWQKQLLFDVDVSITSFAQDEAGEIYLLGDNGGIYRLSRR